MNCSPIRWLVAVPWLFFSISTLVLAQESPPRWQAPPLEQSVSVRDGRTGKVLSWNDLLTALARADVVFLGESHTDETTHRAELAVYEGLLKLRNGRVTLAMEMFERDVQKSLDAYLKGEIDEREFLSQARPWENYRTAYRPLIEAAKRAGQPVLASNFPRPLRNRIALEGPQVLESLEGEARQQAPGSLLPNTETYWKRVDNAIRGHAGMMGGGDRLTSTQSLWDNSMGETCAKALDSFPGHSVLHINGDFHSSYWDGTVHQLRQRKPQAKILTVSISPSANPATAELQGAPVADYVVLAEARATDRNEGTWSVFTQREVKYELHLPEKAASSERVPLLIWLVDDGLTAADGLDLWQSRLGKEAAIAVLEPIHREQQEDLGLGGRWFWPDTFSSDIGNAVQAAERVWGYLSRYYPIDPQRVCVAGEGTGATVAAAISLLTDRMDLRGVANRPRQYAKLKDFSLPLLENWGREKPPQRSLQVVTESADSGWWTGELKSYREVGVSTELTAAAADPWQQEPQIVEAVRRSLGLPAPSAEAVQPRQYLLLTSDAPRARQWARMQAQWLSAREGASVAVVATVPSEAAGEPISTEIRPESFAADDALPRCPGPFGGTTVLVLPPETTSQQLRDWTALAENDPLARQSRFFRLRLATAEGEQSLARVLEKLQSENRKNILIVPAVFYADADWLRALRRSVRHLDDQMTLQWQPGLGGRQAALSLSPDPASEPPLRHELQVTLQPATHRLVVQDRLELPRSLRRAGAEFELNAALQITSSKPAVKRLPAQENSMTARYALEQAPAGGVLQLAYEGSMDFGLSDQKEEYTRGFRQTRGALRTDGVYLDEDSDWVPRFDDRLVRFAMTVQLPEGWQVISQGKGTARDAEGIARWVAEGPMDQIYLVGGPLIRDTESAGSVEVQVYLRERDEGLARKYLDTGVRYLEMYRQLIGPYPYTKFALVENFWETGYGMPSFTLLGPQVIRFPFILHSSYPHEILHNWWGNSVFVDYERGNWCEGLTAYMADHLIQEQRGQGAEYRRNALQRYRDYVREGRDFPLAEFHSRHNAATEAVGYGKSLMMFHMLRRQLGDEAFQAGLQAFYRKYKGQRAGFDDLRTTFESTSEQPWKPFFDQWVQRPGAPRLALRDVHVAPADKKFAVRGVIEQTQSDEPFLLDVPVVVQTAGSSQSSVLKMEGRQQPFEIVVEAAPASLTVDPMFDLFRQLDPQETPPTIGQLFGQSKVLAILPAGSAEAALLPKYRELMESWRSEEHEIEIVLDKDLSEIPPDRAVWVLGRHNRLAASLFADDADLKRDAAAGMVTMAGERVPFADHCVVVIRRHPSNVEQAIGWLVVDPVEAFPGMSRKLPHYGKYSYLAFEGSEPTNTVKGQWDATGSPLVVDLRTDRSQRRPALASEHRPALAELPPVFSSRVLSAHVNWLSDPKREGRGLGTPGIADSAEYIAQAMAAAGLQPGGDDGGWFQKFTVEKGPNGKPVEAKNVIGIVPGKQADWQDQSIVLSAHYDHLGRGWPDVHAGDEGKIHPGADDNASGIAVMLEMARVIAEEGGGPRNLVVIAFSAEEAGRLGSLHYVKHPRFPAAGIRGVINLDAVGRLKDQPVSVLGTGTADEWQHIFRGCTFVTGVPSKNIPEAAGGSDQLSFIEQGIPGVQIFTGAHGDYHRPTDTPDKIEAGGLVKVATFVKEAVTYMLEREPPLTVKIAGAASTPASPTEGGRRVLFGAVPAFDYQGKGVKFESLVPDSPAAAAGLQPGDVLVQLDTETIADLQGFSNYLKKLKPDQVVTAIVLRGGQKVSVKVTVRER